MEEDFEEEIEEAYQAEISQKAKTREPYPFNREELNQIIEKTSIKFITLSLQEPQPEISNYPLVSPFILSPVPPSSTLEERSLLGVQLDDISIEIGEDPSFFSYSLQPTDTLPGVALRFGTTVGFPP